MRVSLAEDARAKINLTLRVVGRRADGYHDLESLVAFADIGDRLMLAPGASLALDTTGPFAGEIGVADDNLVIRAAQALQARFPDLATGRFTLDKHLPVASGIGGGSADAAAALRLLARLNSIALDDPRLLDAARASGADVPVCLSSQSCVMRGVGDRLSPVALPPLHAVLANPGVALATKQVFAAFTQLRPNASAAQLASLPRDRDLLLASLRDAGNDLEAASISLQPAVGDVLAALRRLPGCLLARMSGSGATCFALFVSGGAAAIAAQALAAAQSRWWIRAVTLGASASGTV